MVSSAKLPPFLQLRQIACPAPPVANPPVEPSGGCPSYADSCNPAETLSLDDVQSFLSENWDGLSHNMVVPIVSGGLQPAAANRDVQHQLTPLRLSPSSCLDRASLEPATHSAAADESPVDNPLTSSSPPNLFNN